MTAPTAGSGGQVAPFFGRRPVYVALFSSSVDSSAFEPFLTERDMHPVTGPHGLDREVAVALPALWYFLHLPRTFAELLDLPIQAVELVTRHQPGHSIVLVPVEAVDEVVPFLVSEETTPTLMCAPPALLADAERLSERFSFLLAPIPSDALSDATLREHWATLHRLVTPDRPMVRRVPRLAAGVDDAVVELAVRRFAAQLDRPVPDLAGAAAPEAWLFECAVQHAITAVLSRLEREGVGQADASARLDAQRAAAMRDVEFPVTVAAPGVAAAVRDSPLAPRRTHTAVGGGDVSAIAVDAADAADAVLERSAVAFLAASAAVRDGFAVPIVGVDAAVFAAFARLEAHWTRSRGPDSRTVRRLLGQLDDLARPLWTDTLVTAVEHATSLTVFSNFPLGILRVPGDTAPLACRVPIAYRPLSPLTRALQAELSPSGADFTDGFRVLVAECIPPTEVVGRISRGGWARIVEGFESAPTPGVSYVRVETATVDALRGAIADVAPDVLVLSAHGHTNGNVSGVVVGDELCLGPEFGSMPPVVLLSACHTAVRGRGEVTVADLLLRQGALAVHGAHVPVDVRRNLQLTMRLLLYMQLSVAGEEPHVTLSDAWAHTLAGNPVFDVLYGNPRLFAWAGTPGPRGMPVTTDFMSHASVGRVRLAHAYADTEDVLAGIAAELGVEDRVKGWMRAPGYVPESAMYAFTGHPDRVYLRRPGGQ